MSHTFEPTSGEVQKGDYDTMGMFEKERKGKKIAHHDIGRHKYKFRNNRDGNDNGKEFIRFFS